HSFYWFSIEARSTQKAFVPHTEEGPSELTVVGSWETLLRGAGREQLEALLARGLRTRRWFGGKAREIRRLLIADAVEVPLHRSRAYFVLADLEYTSGDTETYSVPLAFASGDRASELLAYSPASVYARVSCTEGDGAASGVLYDASEDPAF